MFGVQPEVGKVSAVVSSNGHQSALFDHKVYDVISRFIKSQHSTCMRLKLESYRVA